MVELFIGKIVGVELGLGGYGESMFGINFTFDLKGRIVSDFIGTWDPETVKCTSDCCWTDLDRDEQLANLCRCISTLLSDAKVDDINKLVGIPVEITFENRRLQSWRILTEII